MHLSPLQTGFLYALCAVVVAGLGSETHAQTTGTLAAVPGEASTKDQPSSSGSEEPPPGGCMPIGITVSGEVVFPFQCRDFIDRHKAAKQSLVVPHDDHEPVQEKSAAKQPDNVAAPPPEPSEAVAATQSAAAPETTATTPTTKPLEAMVATPEVKAPGKPPETEKPTVPLAFKAAPKAGGEPPSPAKGAPGCTHFRSYDPSSHTYRAYGGQRRACP